MKSEINATESYITNQWVKMNPFEAASRLIELKRENAALQEDKERLDWLSTTLGGYWACEHFQHRNRISRTYIDAGMDDNPTPAELKEAP